MSTLATLTVKLVGDISSFTKAMDEAGDKLQTAGVSMMKAGGIATAGITVPLMGAAAAAIRFGTDLNSGMANIASLGVASSRVLQLKADIQDMAVATGKSTSDLTQGMYQIISAFGDSADAAEKLRINAIAAAAGLSTTKEAIDLTSAVTKGYGDTTATAVQQTADLALKTVQLGQTTFPELAGAIGRVVPIAASLGVAQQELFAIMATGAGVTGTTSEVSSQLRGVLQSLMAPTGDMSKLMAQLGFDTGENMVKQLGLVGAVTQVVQAADAAGVPLQKYIGSIEGQTLALALAGPQAATFQEKLTAMAGAAGTADAAFKAQTEGINANGFAMEQMRIKMEVVMQRIYDGLAPALTQVLDRITPLLDYVVRLASQFAALDPQTQTVILGVLGLAAAIGPLLVVLGMAATALGALLSPIGLVVVAIAAVIAIVAALAAAWANDWGGIQTTTREVMGDIGNRVSEGMDKVKGFVESGLSVMRGWWNEHGGSVKTIVDVLYTAISGFISSELQRARAIVETMLNAIKGFWEAHGSTITTIAKNTWDMIKGIIKGVLDIIGGLVDAFAALLTGDWEKLGDALETIWKGAWEIVESIFKGVKGNLIAIAGDIKATITARIEEMRAGVVAKMNEMKNGAINAANSLKDGVLGALSGMVGEAFSRGAALGQRLADGIRSAIAAVTSAASALAAAIRRFLPGSDAEEGPLSDIYASGQALGATIAAGILSNSAAPAAAAGVMAGGISDVLDLLKKNIVDVVAALADLARTFAGGEEGSDLNSARAGLDAYVPVIEAFGKLLDVVQAAIGVDVVADTEAKLAALTGMVVRVIPGFVAAMVLAAQQFTTTGWVDSVKAFSEGASAAIEPVADGIEALQAINDGVGELDGKTIGLNMAAFSGILGGLVQHMKTIGAYFTKEGWVESVKDFSAGAVAATAPVENGVKALIAINDGMGKLDGKWIGASMAAFSGILGALVVYMKEAGAHFTKEGWVESVKDFSAGAVAATAPVENGIKALLAIQTGIGNLNGSTIGADMAAFAGILGGFVAQIRIVAVQFGGPGLEAVKTFSAAAAAAATQIVSAADAILNKALPSSKDFANASATIGDNIMAGMEFLTRPEGYAPGVTGVMTMIRDAVVGAMYNITAAWASLGYAAYLFGQNWVGQMINGIRSRQGDLVALLEYIRGLFPSSPAKHGPWKDLPDGQRVGQMFADGLAGGLKMDPITTALGALRGQAGGQRTGDGGRTNNVTVNIYNPQGQTAEGDLLRQMRNLAVVGAL